MNREQSNSRSGSHPYLADEISRVASVQELDRARALLVWFLENIHAVDDLDAYEFVADRATGSQVDAVFPHPRQSEAIGARLDLIEVKVGEDDLDPGAISQQIRNLPRPAEIRQAVSSGRIPGVALQVGRHGAVSKLVRGDFDLRYVLLTDVDVDAAVRETIAAAATAADVQLDVFDANRLEPIARGIAYPGPVQATIEISCNEGEILVTRDGSVVVCPVAAMQIVTWPGIDDRTLFDLNVRFELPGNRVRQSLDAAIRRPGDHPDFIEYHNGLTVVCDRILVNDATVTVENISVVNGAQTVVALAANRDHLTPDLRILVKFVAVGAESQVARQVAIRSNMQNPVTPRNLRALDGRQLALAEEFRAKHPAIQYEIRPDSRLASSQHLIRNDDAAQWLCAVYNEQPWLAVKRQSLFNAHNYPKIFPPEIGADEIVLCDEAMRAVQRNKQRFPELYVRSWALTRLTALYLVGQLLRTGDDLRQLLDAPGRWLRDDAGREELTQTLDSLADFAASELHRRRASLADAQVDDYKVEFKRETSLRQLGASARSRFLGSPEAWPGIKLPR